MMVPYILTMTLLFSTRQLAIAAILAFILVSFVTLHRFDSAKAVKGFFGKGGLPKPSPTTPASILLAPTGPPTKGWEVEVDRDGDNHGLTDEQCEIAFPKLFGEIEKSVATRKDNPIPFEEFDSRQVIDGMVRAIVYNGEVRTSRQIPNVPETKIFSFTWLILRICPTPLVADWASLHSLNRA